MCLMLRDEAGVQGPRLVYDSAFLLLLLTVPFVTSGCRHLVADDPRIELSVEQCQFSNFREFPYEHMVYKVEDTFVVRTLEGQVQNADSVWPDGTVLHVQVYRLNDLSSKAAELEVSPEGNFSAPGLAPGGYCLKVSTEGWQTALAAISVDPDAGHEDKIEIETVLGV